MGLRPEIARLAHFLDVGLLLTQSKREMLLEGFPGGQRYGLACLVDVPRGFHTGFPLDAGSPWDQYVMFRERLLENRCDRDKFFSLVGIGAFGLAPSVRVLLV